MRSGSERMHTWRMTPSTGRKFQTLIIWITVSQKASCNGSISVNNFFSWISSIFVGFFKTSRLFVSPCTKMHGQQNIKINRLVLITEAESVYSAVRTESYVKQICFFLTALK